jgi:hypothetical protein
MIFLEQYKNVDVGYYAPVAQTTLNPCVLFDTTHMIILHLTTRDFKLPHSESLPQTIPVSKHNDDV